MKQIDLSDTAIVISLKVDSEDRLANLDRLRSFYEHYGDGHEITVVEQGETAHLRTDPEHHVHSHFLKDCGFHWKTRNMNLGASLSVRPMLLMCDCDVVPHPAALAEGLTRVRSGESFLHLFDGVVTNVSKRFAAKTNGWDDLLRQVSHFDPRDVLPHRSATNPDILPLYGNADYLAVGGAFLCRREDFFKVGGWNENFVSYGYEDQEFDYRVRTLGYSFSRVDGYNLCHFDHIRGPESRYTEIGQSNREELERVKSMRSQDLLAYAQRGFRAISFMPGYSYQRTLTPETDGWTKGRDSRVDLSGLVILVIADQDAVRYFGSCLKAFLEYLETGFHSYDLRICENRATVFKNIHNKTNVTYRTFPQGLMRSDLKNAVRESARSSAFILKLSRDADEQLNDVKAVFDLVLEGQPVASVFQAAELVMEDA